MKHFCFSEAIRDGAKRRPQGFNFYFSEGGSCAFGAAMEAIFEVRDETPGACVRLYPYLDNRSGPCPACKKRANVYVSVSSMIFHLNDEHKWTREQIADFVEQYEESIGFVTISESVESPSLSKSQVTVGV